MSREDVHHLVIVLMTGVVIAYGISIESWGTVMGVLIAAAISWKRI